jgi:hypothetical protein
MFYPNCMPKLNLHLTILLPVVLILVLPRGSDVQPKGRSVEVESEVAASVDGYPSPCTELHVTSVGVVCKSKFDLVARLDFPEVDLKSALAGREYLPRASTEFAAHEKAFGDKLYRNIVFILRWESNTPEFLQIYLKEYLPYWGNRVPYRLFWGARYEVCSSNCTEWVTVDEKGEFLPSDVKDLSADLAADANFNGVPVAFWNTNVIP